MNKLRKEILSWEASSISLVVTYPALSELHFRLVMGKVTLSCDTVGFDT